MLRSSFRVSATLLSGLSLLEMRLGSNPALKQISRGTRLSYALVCGPGAAESQVIEFDTSYISYTYLFENPGMSVYSTNLARFLAILGFVDGLYDVKLGSLYAYILEAIDPSANAIDSHRDAARFEAMSDMLESLNQSNMSLAASLAAAKKAVHEANGKAAHMEKMGNAIADAFAHIHGDKWASIVSERSGIDVGSLMPKPQKR